MSSISITRGYQSPLFSHKINIFQANNKPQTRDQCCWHTQHESGLEFSQELIGKRDQRQEFCGFPNTQLQVNLSSSIDHKTSMHITFSHRIPNEECLFTSNQVTSCALTSVASLSLRKKPLSTK